MAPRFCPHCGPGYVEVETDDKLGHVVCRNCGSVMEENTIVSEVTFSESSKGAAIADGFQLDTGQARAKTRGTFGLIRTGSQESREQTIQNGHRRIQEIANQPQIRMNERLVQVAQRFFNLAVSQNFTKGRKAGNVVAACLYIVCRLEKTAHMLIDFADALSTNVYQVGATFLALCKIVSVPNLPLVDPSLYISRFATKLDFGDQTQLIIKDSNRLVQRMNRDWIQTGRRPSGICAASLFIASRMHGFDRTIREIVMVVKICEGTLRKRLKEFQETPSSNLTVTDFQTIWLEEAKDPPSFAPPKSRLKTEILPDGSSGRRGSKAAISATTATPTATPTATATATASQATLTEDDAAAADADVDGLLDETAGILGSDDTRRAAASLQSGESSTARSRSRDSESGGGSGGEGVADDGRLSELDSDEDIQAMIDVTEDEIQFKTAIWTEENKDWILRQEAKLAQEADSSVEKRKPRKRQKTHKKFEAPTAAEAAKNLIMSKPALSKKINYGVLETLFQKTETDPVTKPDADADAA
ncbi:cyclin-like protein [Entophlyctis helioformis]|nr:cyclin-like protein [Entophlyctis helioformis]